MLDSKPGGAQRGHVNGNVAPVDEDNKDFGDLPY